MVTADSKDQLGRRFDTFPAGVLCYVLRPDGRFLLLKHPRRAGLEVVSGAVEAGETLLAAAVRELAEETGSSMAVRPLGVFHASSFAYEDTTPNLISVHWLFAYQAGEVMPADDMAGATVAWMTCDEIAAAKLTVPEPVSGRSDWLFRRALAVYPGWVEDGHIVEIDAAG